MGMKIRNKADMYELLLSGRLGNTVRMWQTPEEASADGWTDTVGIRCMGRPGLPHIMHCPLDQVYQQCDAAGIRREEILLNEDPPYDIRTFNGEVSRTPAGLSLRYRDDRGLLMREAMTYPKYAMGLEALMLLQARLVQKDGDKLFSLMDEYDGATDDSSAVVEFSLFDRQVGWVSGSRMIVWEVRSY